MTRQDSDSQQAQQAAFLLRLSARPVLVAGRGTLAAGAGDELARLADRINAPVLTTWGGKSALADSHDMAAGALFGQPEAGELLEDADCLLAVGVNFDDQPGADLDLPSQMIQIDWDYARLGGRYPLRQGIAGDAKVVLARILTALQEPSPLRGAPGDRTEPGADAPTGPERAGSVRAKQLRSRVLGRAGQEGAAQISALQTLRQAIHPRALTVGMPGSSIVWTAPFFEIRIPGTWITGENPPELFRRAGDLSTEAPVVVFCDSPDLQESLGELQGCQALTVIAFLHGGSQPTKLMESCLAAGLSTILVDTPTEIAAALTVMMRSGSPSVILATFRWDRD